MKVRTFLICFLAVCAAALTSCNGNKDYTENFVGNYELTMTPNFEVAVESEIPGIDDMFDFDDIDATDFSDDVICSIVKVGEDNDVKVTLSYEEDGEVVTVFAFTGTCDKTGLCLNSLTFSESVAGDMTDMGDVTIEMTIGSSTIGTPVDGKISWTSSVSGTIEINILTEVVELPIAINITGSIDFVGVKK